MLKELVGRALVQVIVEEAFQQMPHHWAKGCGNYKKIKRCVFKYVQDL
jgi:hypothetical protein